MKKTIQTQLRQTAVALVALALVLSVLGPVGTAAAAPGVSVTQSADSTTVTPGETIQITTTVSHEETNSLALDLALPEGWNVTDQSAEGESVFKAATNQWAWTAGDSDGVSNQYEVTYMVQVPEDATGEYAISADGSAVVPDTGEFVDDSDSITITVEEEQTNTAPTADAGSAKTVDEGASVTLDASGSSDSDGDSLSYSWSQTGGDSVSLSDASSATPSFAAPSVDSETTLTFEVAVADGNGGTDTDTVSVTVQPVNEDPTASISGPTSAQVGDEVTFTATTSDDGSIASYSWNLGDGTTATGETVSHTYESAGDYDVSVTVTDDEGATTTATQGVSVDEPATPANFQVSNLNAPDSATQGDTVDVSATVENTGDEEATQTVEFTFDGSVVDSQEVTLAGDASQQVDFSVDTSGVESGTYTHGVSTEDDSATAQITVEAVPSTTVSIQPSSADVTVGDATTFDVVVDDADDGVGAYEMTLELDSPNAEITDVELATDPDESDVAFAADNSSVTIAAALGNSTNTGSVPIVSVTVTGTSEGTVNLTPTVSALGTESGQSYDVSDTASASITVTDLPPVGDFENASTDADGDGTLEDVNGDGTFDVVDVQALFANRDDSTVQNNPALYDFNGDGTFDVVDVQALFVELIGGDS